MPGGRLADHVRDTLPVFDRTTTVLTDAGRMNSLSNGRQPRGIPMSSSRSSGRNTRSTEPAAWRRTTTQPQSSRKPLSHKTTDTASAIIVFGSVTTTKATRPPSRRQSSANPYVSSCPADAQLESVQPDPDGGSGRRSRRPARHLTPGWPTMCSATAFQLPDRACWPAGP